MDDRNKVLARNLVLYSMEVKPGDNVYVHFIGEQTEELARAIIQEVYTAGGIPFPHYTCQRVLRELLLHCNVDQIRLMAEVDAAEMSRMDCYVAVRGNDNVAELSDVPSDKMAIYDKFYMDPIHHQIRVPKTRWVVLRYPNYAMAQLSNMSTDAFEDFYYKVCNLDYEKMGKAMNSLAALMDRTDKVRMVGPGTDLTFSIKGIPSVTCCGKRNIPDGEVYTAPIRNSVQGMISYNASSLYQGTTFENVTFVFKEGKIVEATANNTERLNEILDSDEGARYIGEFAIGVNPHVLSPMKDILFDEKICGSIHFTPGNCYEEASNGNTSVIHWDLVWIQRPEYGGGEIYFDDVLIRKDGIFVIPELLDLNPQKLKV